MIRESLKYGNFGLIKEMMNEKIFNYFIKNGMKNSKNK